MLEMLEYNHYQVSCYCRLILKPVAKKSLHYRGNPFPLVSSVLYLISFTEISGEHMRSLVTAKVTLMELF